MARRRKGLPLNGWLAIDKAPGMTSAQVVARVRRITGAAKAGHAGTLDPLASGVLPIALGEATKTVGYAQDAAKAYAFTVRFGEERDTDDAEGAVVRTSDRRPTDAEIGAALPAFTGAIMQAPPSYSAIKVSGERAYDLARDGEAVTLEPRPVRIDGFRLAARPDADHAVFTVECGKGAYVRALARDLGRALGCLGHVVQLRRTRVGGFHQETAISLEKLAELCDTAPPDRHLLPVATALDDIPALAVTGPQAERLSHGQSVKVLFAADGLYRAECAGSLVAVVQTEAGDVRPLRVFNL